MERLRAPIPRDAQPTTPEQLALQALVDRLFADNDQRIVFSYNQNHEVEDG